MSCFYRSFIHLLFILLVSCSLSEEDDQADRVKEANLYLTNGECQSAIDTLAEVSYDLYDYRYVQTLASAHACKGGFSEIDFFSSDLDNINTSAFLASLATFSSSPETTVDSTEYTSLKTAVGSILFTFGTLNTRAVERINYYGSVIANDLHLQVLYLLLGHLGKWLYFFGNTNTAGEKGQGSLGNICVYPYGTVAQALVDANSTGVCEAPYTGSSKLDISAETAATVYGRVCDFIVHVNHVFDVFENVTLSTNTTNGDLSGVLSQLTSLKSTATGVNSTIADIFSLYTYDACTSWLEADVNNVLAMEAYFAVFVETNF
jgi:hypothetical protein